jgi:hypothetical protein
MKKLLIVGFALCHVALTQAAVWPAGSELAQLFQQQPPATSTGLASWTVLWSGPLDRPICGWGPPLPAAGRTPDELLASVKAQAYCSADFAARVTQRVRRLTRMTFREQRAGLSVVSGRADLIFNARDELMRWNIRAHDMFPVAGTHQLDVHTCASQLAPAMQGEFSAVSSVQPVYFPDEDSRTLLPAYWIRLSGAAPDQRWVGIVDANSGAVLLEWPGIATDVLSGTVNGAYWPEYLQEPAVVGIHPHQTVFVDSNVVITNAGGAFSREAGQSARVSARLRGPYVFVENEDAPAGDWVTNVNAPYAPLNIEWSTAQATAPELNLYYHTTFIHDWYKILDPDYNALDYPLPAVANIGSGYDNAYWNGYGTYYGSGSTYGNFAMFSDVIYHEYTHGVTDGIYPDDMLPYVGEPGAMNEAWSDYFACTLNEDPLMAERMLGNNPHSYFRNLENNMVYPRDWRGEVHADSPFISGALWIIRQQMGAAFADSLSHFARYGLAETFIDYLIAVLETDDDDGDLSNGTPHGDVIYGAFGVHGIGPGNDPEFVIQEANYVADGSNGSVGDGDRFMEQGETVALSLRLLNGAILFPPPAENVIVTISTTDPDAPVIDGTRTLPLLQAGQSLAIEPVQITLAAQTRDRWLRVNVHVSCTNSPKTLDYVLEFTIGTPHLLVVADDATDNVEHFVTDVMREQDRIFERVELLPTEDLSTAFVPEYGVILWLSGNQREGVLSASDRDILRTYMEAGNKIVLSGQDIVDDLSATDFYQSQLQVQLISDSILSNSVSADAAPLPVDDWYIVTGSRGASNQRRPSAFEPYGSSRTVAHYGRGESGPGSVIEFMNGRGLLFGFGIEAVSGMAAGSSSLADLLESIYTWAGALLPVDESRTSLPKPESFALYSAFPNPFNSTTTIRYSLSVGKQAEVRIFDLTGRIVETLHVSAGASSVSWSPTIASGVYFAQLVGDNQTSLAQKLLLLK